MSNIVNLKLGTETVTKILQDDVLKETGNDILKWYKVANDAGGYYCRGIFVQPVGNNNAGFYWYWDLGCQTGIKDNGDWNQFGYIYDGDNKNITSGMTLPFSNPGSWDTTANYNDGWFFQICIVSDRVDTLELAHPITIQFVDDRFDSCRFEVTDGTTLSEDKRTLTITKLKDSYGVVCKIKGATNWSKTDLETNLKDIIVNVHGLQSNVLINPDTDWGSVEIWDVSLGNNEVYKKERTVDNYLKQYKLLGEQAVEDYKRLSIGTQSTSAEELYKYTDQIYIPIIVDLVNWYKTNIDGEYEAITFNVLQSNSKFWDEVRECLNYKVKELYNKRDIFLGLLQNSNIDGEVTLTFEDADQFKSSEQAFNKSSIEKINFNFKNGNTITSLNKIFNQAQSLKEITNTYPFGCADVSGMVTNSAVALRNGQIAWGSKSMNTININNQNISVSSTFTSYFLDGYKGTTVEQFGGDRFTDTNTLVCAGSTQMFCGCNNITVIGPVLDFRYLVQEKTTFAEGNKIEDIRIKNLNHCDWIFDGVERNNVNGYLLNLNSDSIEYLFANLYDLTSNNPDLVYGQVTDEEYGTNPWIDHANLYCPEQWRDKITPEMIDEANLKGWSVYINNILQ